VVIYHADGTVAVSHSGIEMGQGINTKVAQVVAKMLQIPLKMVKILPADNFVGPNSTATDASNGSECVCQVIILANYPNYEAYFKATQKACEDLVKRMAPFNSKEHKTWQDFVHSCYRKGVDLTANYM